MIRMLIVGYVFGDPVGAGAVSGGQVNLAYRWFCGLSIEDRFRIIRPSREPAMSGSVTATFFGEVFERVVEACIAAGLVGGEGFAVDASLIAADANKQRSIQGAEWIKERDPETASRAVKEYLATLDDAAFGAATRSRRSSSRRPIRRHNGPGRCGDRHSSPMPTTI